jgi:hypothetical protein
VCGVLLRLSSVFPIAATERIALWRRATTVSTLSSGYARSSQPTRLASPRAAAPSVPAPRSRRAARGQAAANATLSFPWPAWATSVSVETAASPHSRDSKGERLAPGRAELDRKTQTARAPRPARPAPRAHAPPPEPRGRRAAGAGNRFTNRPHHARGLLIGSSGARQVTWLIPKLPGGAELIVRAKIVLGAGHHVRPAPRRRRPAAAPTQARWTATLSVKF